MERKKEKYNTLLNTSLKLFARYGYKKTTVDDIASELNMTKGNIYFYVKNKKDLYENSVNYALIQWQNHVQDAVDKADNIIEKFKTLALEAIEYIDNNKIVQTILINDPSIFTLSSNEDRFYETNVTAKNMIKNILTEGVNKKIFYPVDIDHLTEYLFSIYIMFLIKNYVKSDNNSSKKMFREGLELTLRGLLV